jgi:hypothetical protein
MQKAIIISIISLVTGALLVLTGYFVYTVIKMGQKVEQNTATLVQVVNFLHEQISKSNPTPEVK